MADMIEHLGKYRIDGILGKGAMGVVYKAFDPSIERVVALKTIRKELFSDTLHDELIARFKNEAQAAGRLHHPNIVMVYDYGDDSESAYIAMEFVEGTPLNDLMTPSKPTELARVTAWMGDLLLALEYAHSRGVVHRDIKPANLLITAAAQVKVGDFGIARIESSTLTQTGSMVGTPSYMSPEQFRGEVVDGRSDVFSAGIVLYQLLTGVRPFVGSASAVMQQILNQDPLPPSQLLPPLGSGYDRILARAMAKAPGQRYPSARAFLDALAALGQGGADAGAAAGDDRTMLAAGLRRAGAAPQGSGPATGTMAPWKLEALAELDAILSRQIGPMARLLLNKAAAKADGIDELCELLLPHIPSELGRSQFRQSVLAVKKKLAASGTGSGVDSLPAFAVPSAVRTAIRTGVVAPGSFAASAPVPFDAAFAEAAAQRLMKLIGPIARVVAKRAQRHTGDKAEFLRLLAASIEALPERARFLAESGSE